MRTPLPLLALLLLAAAIPPAASAAPAREPGAGARAAATTTISTRSVGRFGTVLVDGRGLPLYIFTSDRGKRSRCSGACARAWPVTVARGTVRARGAARAGLLGTTRRGDGRRQVTYRGRPVYTYVSDRPGVALCHDVREFGGLWLLVRPDGKRVP